MDNIEKDLNSGQPCLKSDFQVGSPWSFVAADVVIVTLTASSMCGALKYTHCPTSG